MKLTLVALPLAALCTWAWSSDDAVALNPPAGSEVWTSAVVQVTPVAPLARRASHIVSAQAAVEHIVQPKFPREMRRRNQPGFVRLEVLVADDGRVLGASVIESSCEPFTREALRAVEQWQFRPAAAPQPGGCRAVLVPIEFRIFRPLR